MDRKEYLLRQVLKLSEAQENSSYVLDMHSIELFYDDTECDGYCLIQDIKDELMIEGD